MATIDLGLVRGQGVPTGGVAGQVLAKKSGTDYDTEWVTSTGGGGCYVDVSTESLVCVTAHVDASTESLVL